MCCSEQADSPDIEGSSVGQMDHVPPIRSLLGLPHKPESCSGAQLPYSQTVFCIL